jgi:hypothetical protein
VQEWMGHADIETTRKYLHLHPGPTTLPWSPRPSPRALGRRRAADARLTLRFNGGRTA